MVKESTRRVYSYPWRLFCNWCAHKGIKDPHKKNFKVVNEFFEEIAENMGETTFSAYLSSIAYFIREQGGTLDSRSKQLRRIKNKIRLRG